MDRSIHIRKLVELVGEEWGRVSILAHNRISEIRSLLNMLGEDFETLDDIAVEIETITSTALGMGDERLTDDDIQALSPILREFLNELYQLPEVRSAST